MKNYIKGTFRRSIYASEKGYTIGLFKVRETNDEEMEEYINKTITFTGYFHDLSSDDTYVMYGELINHPRYGVQYDVNEYERVMPETKDGLIEFLASDLFPSVGEKLAKKIVDKLGNETIKTILEDYHNLLGIKGITEKKAKQISDILVTYQDSETVVVSLTNLGFNMKEALMIYNRFKANTLETLNNNPYDLVSLFDEITFSKIDSMLHNLNIKEDDERRISACIIYIMDLLNFTNGHTYATKKMIYDGVTNYLKFTIDSETFDYYLVNLNKKGDIAIANDKYYLINYYQAELNISNTFHYLMEAKDKEVKKLDNYLETLEKYYEINYNEIQRHAIKEAISKNLLVITGGPGTGKTTIIKAIVEIYRMKDNLDYEELVNSVALLAPTGRAAKRMSEATLMPAYTIHRFLKWNKETNSFAVNEYNKAKVKFVIIDEASMIDTLLLDSLLKGLPKDIHLIIVGDYNQLPSVAPGQVLKDIIESDSINVIKLNLLYRQKDTSYIPILASEINDNNLTNYKEAKSDYQFIEASNHNIKRNIQDICQNALNKGYTCHDIQVLIPMYKGEAGIDNINQILQEIFNPKDKMKKEINYGEVVYRENDKIIQLKNMPDDNIFNGDIGVIKRILEPFETESKRSELEIDFDGNVVRYTQKEFINIKHAYAMSIHKSQGSEFKIVVMILSGSHQRMLYRKLIYTGVTRAKKSLIVLGSNEAFIYSVSNNNENERLTGLKEFLSIK